MKKGKIPVILVSQLLIFKIIGCLIEGESEIRNMLAFA